MVIGHVLTAGSLAFDTFLGGREREDREHTCDISGCMWWLKKSDSRIIGRDSWLIIICCHVDFS